MERFSGEIKRSYAELDGPSHIESVLGTLHGLKTADCDGIALSPVSMMPAKVVILLQVGLRRTIELVEAAIREINRHNLATSALLSRAVLETSCLLWDVMRQVDVATQDTGGDMGGLDELLSRALLGGKSKDHMVIEEVQARNVLTIVQRLTKQLDIPLVNFYEGLSEYAHPNYHGMMGTYTEFGLDGGIKVFADHRTDGERAIMLAAIGTLATSVDIVVECFRLLASSLRPLTVLAERAIYDGGTWPSDVEYPVNRD
jgi:hypothetical protein